VASIYTSRNPLARNLNNLLLKIWPINQRNVFRALLYGCSLRVALHFDHGLESVYKGFLTILLFPGAFPPFLMIINGYRRLAQRTMIELAQSGPMVCHLCFIAPPAGAWFHRFWVFGPLIHKITGSASGWRCGCWPVQSPSSSSDNFGSCRPCELAFHGESSAYISVPPPHRNSQWRSPSASALHRDCLMLIAG